MFTDFNASELQELSSEMRNLIERYEVDLACLNRSCPIHLSASYFVHVEMFLADWLELLSKLDFDAMSPEGRMDYLLFRNHLEVERRRLSIRDAARRETAPLLPFAQTLIDLEEARRHIKDLDPSAAADALDHLMLQIQEARQAVEADASLKAAAIHRACRSAGELHEALERWFAFYNEYDPRFTWWAAQPYEAANKALRDYEEFLRTKTAGEKETDAADIVGDPIGREALLHELAYEMIPYTPEELIEIGEREFAWCEAEMVRASRELGYGDAWHEALEAVKTRHMEPGKQPALIRDLAWEAVRFLEERDLVTIPSLAREAWRMTMMTAEQQKVNPFFLGGETIYVSFPTHAMTHSQKRMSLRGNNIHFARATVQHELIPGHHLQMFMLDRHRPWRRVFSTIFWIEGWTLYWELLLWEKGFPQSPEDRIGMLFWRMHRCARILFSLKFHLEQMTPRECIDLLVERVGHERDNAVAEVRRSFNGDYPPLYQAAYMLGGLQMLALRREMVEGGKMSERAFHDAVLKQNSIPIAMLRAALMEQPLDRNFSPHWRFYAPLETENPQISQISTD